MEVQIFLCCLFKLGYDVYGSIFKQPGLMLCSLQQRQFLAVVYSWVRASIKREINVMPAL